MKVVYSLSSYSKSDFHSGKKKKNTIKINRAFLCVQQNKHIHSDLEKLEGE